MSTEATTRWNVTSDEAQREFGPLLGAVIREAAHVTISCDGEPAAVLVPAHWHELAEELIAQKWDEAAATFMKPRHSTDPKDSQ